MKKIQILLIFLIVFTFFVLSSNVETLPFGTPRERGLYQPSHWFVKETPSCPYGYQCRSGMWVPQLYLYRDPIWVFGISSWEYGVGGTLNFRKLPDYPCTQHCYEEVPILYTAEVIYVPPWDPPDISPEDAQLTYIPAGYYVVTSPSFTIYQNTKIWYFPDNGIPWLSAHLEPEEPEYSRGETVKLFLQVTDLLTGERIQVDTITGKVVLPDTTEEELTTDMWSWNPDDEQYECDWDNTFQEGEYSVSVTVYKASHGIAKASTTFTVGACYDVYINLTLEEEPPIVIGDTVHFTAIITDENGEPVSGDLLYEFKLPSGLAELNWEEDPDGVYKASYTTELAGTHFLRVWLEEDASGNCTTGEASLEFEVIGEGEFDCQFSEAETENLVETYSPHMYFFEGVGEEEIYFPTEVILMLQYSTFWYYGPSHSERIEEYESMGIYERIDFISGFTDSDHYLDLEEVSCHKPSESIIAQQSYDLDAYCRVTCEVYEGEPYIMIQYWFFYIFNDHANNHEGEWEMIEVLLDYRGREPIGACYSRHEGGEYRPWEEITKMGTHPVVYVAEGSHAAYFTEGFFGYHENLDKTSDDGRQGRPKVSLLAPEPPWLEFGGNWGYRRRVVPWDWCMIWWNSAPHGPKYQGEKWNDPVGWAFSHEKKLPEIIRSPYTLIALTCPADMLVTNSAGQRLGYANGEFVQEIPHSYVHDLDEEEFYLITGIDYYTVEIFGTGEGFFDLVYAVNVWNTAKTLKYRDVPVTAATKAVLNVSSDLSLSVDTNGDGIIDFTVNPDSVELSCPQPIKPLQVGTGMVYEVTLTNQGPAATFVLEVDPPATWSYILSADQVMLQPGESATLLLTVTSPPDTPVQDYTIRFEATSLDDNDMTTTLDLIASSKSELIAENMTVSEGEEVVLTAMVSNMGLIDAENVKVQFFNGPPGSDLLGEKIIQVGSGETATTFVSCSLPDGFYTFSVVVDPDNLISESCEFNNELSIQYLLDRTPPEAEIFFDPESEDLAVRGVDNLDPSVDVLVIEEPAKNRDIRTYILTDDAGNTLKLQLEIKRTKHELKAEIIGLEYNDTPVAVLTNSIKVEYIVEQGNVKMLNQFFIIGDINVHLIYDRNKDQTKTIINGTTEYQEGLIRVVISTSKGDLAYRFEKI